MKLKSCLLAAAMIAAPAAAAAQPIQPQRAPEPDPNTPIHAVVIHPIFQERFTCAEHYEGELAMLGDTLGADCHIIRQVDTPNGGTVSRSYRGDGLQNEDWFTWREPVLAPVGGVVVFANENAETNEVGVLGDPPPGGVLIRRDDALMVVVAHLRELEVRQGDHVEAGQRIGRAGNNGTGRMPHVHLGAWRGETPYQLRFDLRAMGALME